MGRYQLVTVVGAGGMGVVFEARDPELDRTVAVKILRESTSASETDGARRLRREGQTMARLAHPNVLRVYDVGVDHGHVFVAMEFVSGGTLAHWLAREPRTPDAVVAAFVEAGRGLAAAHDAGLVHRDFKPANVMVASDGRVLVTDFGLARSPAAEQDAPSESPDLSLTTTPPTETVTREGQRVGTPAYMAPEQHAGRPVDARADQFSFAVALWRALYGTPPYAGSSAAELAVTTASGVRIAPSAETSARVPAWVRVSLERALASDPAQRFPSMNELLAALQPPAAPSRGPQWGVTAVAAAGVAGVVGLWALDRSRSAATAAAGDVCAATVDRAAAVWGDDVAASVRAAFVATGEPYAEAAHAEVSRQLARWAADWEAARRDSCEDTRVRREQSDAMMDLRASCLDRRLGEVSAFVGELSRADATVVRGAARAGASIGEVSVCGDAAALARRSPLPADPARRNAIAAAERDIDVARAQFAAGRYKEAREGGDVLVARARATGYAPVLADALFVVAKALPWRNEAARARALLDEAVLAAEAGGDDALRFECEVALTRLVGYDLEQDADGLEHAQRAAALLVRLGPDLRRQARLLDARATVDWWHGRYADAHRAAEEAVALFERSDAQGADLATTLHMRAIIEDDLGNGAATSATEDLAIAIGERAFGARHPSVANFWGTKGNGLRRIGRFEESRAAHLRSLEIIEAVHGPESMLAGDTLVNLATVDLDENKYADAIPRLERALAIVEKAVGADHGRTGLVVERLGSALSNVGRNAEAEAALRRAIAIHRARIGPDAPPTAASHKQLGDHFLRSARPSDARNAYREAVRAYHASQGERTPLATQALVGLGDAELALGRRAAAVAAYERAQTSVAPDAAPLRDAIAERLTRARAR